MGRRKSDPKRSSSGGSSGSSRAMKRSKVHSSLQIVEINTTKECVHLHNFGKHDVDLEGLSVADIRGDAKSRPFPPAVIRPGQTVVLWTAPGYDTGEGPIPDEDAENIYWRNRSNGNPRARPVLNNDGDGIKLLDPAGGVITMSYTSGSDDEEEDADAATDADAVAVETTASAALTVTKRTAVSSAKASTARHTVIRTELYDDSELWKRYERTMNAVEKRMFDKYA